MEEVIKIGDTVRIKPYGTEHEVLSEGTSNRTWWLSDGVGNFYKHLCKKVHEASKD